MADGKAGDGWHVPGIKPEGFDTLVPIDHPDLQGEVGHDKRVHKNYVRNLAGEILYHGVPETHHWRDGKLVLKEPADAEKGQAEVVLHVAAPAKVARPDAEKAEG